MLTGILLTGLLIALATLFGPHLIRRSCPNQKINRTKNTLNNLVQALEQFKKQAGRFPTTAEGLAALAEKPALLTHGAWDGPYVQSMPLDGYGNPLIYFTIRGAEAEGYEISSAGLDGLHGTEDDISSQRTSKRPVPQGFGKKRGENL